MSSLDTSVISFELDIFNELRKKYTDWESLRSFLESEEGGYIRVIDKSNKLCIVRYDKQMSNFNLPHTKWFRSVVWDTIKNIPISIAPPKSSSVESFDVEKNIKDCFSSGIYCQEFIEGFMINCFKIAGDDKFYITSRSCFDATGKFYSMKNFRELFNESIINTNNSMDNFLECYAKDVNISNNELSRFYSFVVYHPEHRMVSKRDTPGYYEVQSGIVYSDGKVVIQDNMSIPKIMKTESESVSESVEVSESDKTESVQEFVQTFFSKKDWAFQGIVFKDLSGNRWRFRNEKYQMVKSLRGNNADPLKRFVLMFQQNITRKYLEFYPEDSILFQYYNVLILTLINTMHNYYKSLHVYKIVLRDDIDKMYWPHLYNLHGYYLANIKEKGLGLSVVDIHQYLQKQPWQRVVFLMNKFMGELGL
jgi:hypothetical protein